MNFSIPLSFRKLVVKRITPIFKEAVDIIQQNLTRPSPKEVLVKTKYVGINASDVNAAAGRYFSGNQAPPFEIGFEGIGEVVEVGENVDDLTYGKPVMFMKMGSFSEYVCVPENEIIPVASCDVKLLPLLVSGSTAGLSLDKCGRIVPGEKVLITAAAGGAGHIAVQYAKNFGCHVIGLCSSQDKVKFLESIGCDRPINYKRESLVEILKTEYANGVDVIWETIGGEVFDLLFKNLSTNGRMIIVGATSKYKEQNLRQDVDQNVAIKLMLRSASLNGFFLPHFKNGIPHYLSILVRMMHEQKLNLHVDDGSLCGNKFVGLESITKAVDHLYSGKSIGKVVVAL